MFNLLLFSFILPQIYGFIFRNQLNKNIKIKYKNIEFSEKIYYNEKKDKIIIDKINGFYGLIGPDINMSNINNLYDLFMGNGIIQGVFFDNGNVTFVKKFIETEKLIHDEIFHSFHFYKIFNKIKNINILFPNILGLANTALFNVNKEVYALFERDRPYLIDIDFINKDIRTLSKINIRDVHHFSAHSKFNKKIIETIDYKILEKKVTYHQLDTKFHSIFKKDFNMVYIPVIHDFLSTNLSFVLFDFPLKIDIKNILKKRVSVLLDPSKPTIINIMNKETKIIEKYFVNESFYIFHFADYYENNDTIEIYASIYEKLDFSSLTLEGKFRKIIINKKNKKVYIEKNRSLENMNLDFPVKYDDKIILRNSFNNTSNEFIICKNLTIHKKIIIPEKCICGEPTIKIIDGEPYLFSFLMGYKNSLMIINLANYSVINLHIKSELNIGFHSIFIQNNSLY